MKVDGLKCHDTLVTKLKQRLSYGTNPDYKAWKQSVKEKFIELIGLEEVKANEAADPCFEIEAVVKKDGYTRTRFTFYSEVDAVVSCYILVPDNLKEKRPVCITLQGHSTGFHNSIGEPKFEEDFKGQPRTAFAVQAVKEGYIAVAIEQRAMGERSACNQENRRVHIHERINRCYYETITAALMGRTVAAERIFDVMKTIDVLKEQFSDVCDFDKIAITGNSGGGTTSFYAACIDERIKISLPSCAFCPFPESILKFYHCSCNYIPSAFKWFDMQDISCLIAPRKLSIIAGQQDPSFLIEGVRRGYETVKKIYREEGAENNCTLIESELGHYWRDDLVWPEMKRLMDSL